MEYDEILGNKPMMLKMSLILCYNLIAKNALAISNIILNNI
ncbi:hypothetical protein [Clostridium sporogenes]|nr:hypothetical protein [Clostridium botulinum]